MSFNIENWNQVLHQKIWQINNNGWVICFILEREAFLQAEIFTGMSVPALVIKFSLLSWSSDQFHPDSTLQVELHPSSFIYSINFINYTWNFEF